jgi:hypothetical protein
MNEVGSYSSIPPAARIANIVFPALPSTTTAPEYYTPYTELRPSMTLAVRCYIR